MNSPVRYCRTPVRWCAGLKRDVLRQIDDGLISEARACRLYRISPEELEGWRAGRLMVKQAGSR